MYNERLDKIKNRLLDEFKRYEINLELILSLRHLIKRYKLILDVLPPERKIISRHNSKPKTPDLLITDNKKNYLINEMKSSVNPDNDILSQIDSYMNTTFVLDEYGNNLHINDFSLNIFVNIESYSSLKNYLTTKKKLNNKISITSFGVQESLPKKGMRFYYFELRDNDTIFQKLNELLKSIPQVFYIEIQPEGEQIYFAKDPYIQYVITIIWTLIIPSIRKEDKFSFQDVEEIIVNYYSKWDDKRTFYKRYWLKKAINKLIEMRWIKKINNKNFKIIKTLNLPGDIKEIVCKTLAKLELEAIMNREGKGKQIPLSEFF